MTLHIRFEREDGSQYDAEFDPDDVIRLAEGEIVSARDLTCGDEIESHHSTETGGRGHLVVR